MVKVHLQGRLQLAGVKGVKAEKDYNKRNLLE